MKNRPTPNAVLVWDPNEFQTWSELEESDEQAMWLAGCLSDTRSGSRAACYRTRADQGIVGFFDFSSDAFRHPDLGWAAYGRPAPLKQSVRREELLADPALREVFLHIQNRRHLPPTAQRRLADLVGPMPVFARVDEPLPSPDEAWEWVPAHPDRDWGVEASMRDAIVADRRSWRKLGFAERPIREVHPPGSDLRVDLWAPGTVAECKIVVVGLAALRQLDRYLDLYRANRGGDWVGHLIVAAGYTTELAAAVTAREDIWLWMCHKDLRGKPRLTKVTTPY